MKRKVRPNVVSGGTAVNLGDNLYYMRGKTHKQGGIDIGSNPKTGIEVENGEVVQTSPTGLRVFSAQPILNGISPANALLMGGNPNNIFNAQEAWKQANHYNDDGTKFKIGGDDIPTSNVKKELIKLKNKIDNKESIDDNPINKNIVSKNEDIERGYPYLYKGDAGLKFYKKKGVNGIIYGTSKYNESDLSDYEEIPYETVRKMLPKRDYIGGNDYRQRVVDKVPGLKSFIKAKAEEYGISPNLLFHRFLREGIVDRWTNIYNDSIYTDEQESFFRDKAGKMAVSGFGDLGLDDVGTNLLEEKYTLKNPNISWEESDAENEHGRQVKSAIFNNIWDGIEVKAAEMAYRQAELAKRGIVGDQFVNAAYNMGLNHKDLNNIDYINKYYSVPNYFEFGGESKSYTPSKEIIDYIKKTEGFSDKWYKDGNGIDTIGYGFTGDNVKKLFADGITREQADKYFLEILNRRAKILEKDTPNWDKLTQSQKDSLLSYAYNIGPGNYKRSKKLQEALLNEDWDNVANNISIGYNDKRNPGLRKRRDYERELFKRDIKSSFTGDEEKAFRDWYDRYSRSQNLDPNPDAKEHYYDYRTYWKNRTEQQKNDEWKLGNHLPNTYKMPGHPTFSTESIYSTRKTPGGTWKKVGLGPVYDEQFVDSKYTKNLRKYQNVSFALGGEDDKFAVRDNTRTRFVPGTGYVPNAKLNKNIGRDVQYDAGPLGFVPVIGDILQGGQAVSDFKNKNYKRAALNAGLLLVPNAVEKLAKPIVKAGIKAVKRTKYTFKENKELIKQFNDFAKKYGYPEIKIHPNHTKEINDQVVKTLHRHNTFLRGVYMPTDEKELKILRKTLPNASDEQILEYIATNPHRTANGVQYVSPYKNAIIYGSHGKTFFVERPFKLGADRTKWIEEASFPIYATGSHINADKAINEGFIKKGDVIFPWGENVSGHENEFLIKGQLKSRGVAYDNEKFNKLFELEYGSPEYKKLHEEEQRVINSLEDKTSRLILNADDSEKITDYLYRHKNKYGGIHIKPSKRGTFTAAAKRHHMSVQEFARTVLNNRARYSAAMVKKANFARNASKWHKKELGGDMTKQYYITKDNIYSLGRKVEDKQVLGFDDKLGLTGSITPSIITDSKVSPIEHITNYYKLKEFLRRRRKAPYGTEINKPQRYYENGTVYYKVGDRTFTKEEFANVYGVNINDVDTKFDFDDLTYIPKYPRNSYVPNAIISPRDSALNPNIIGKAEVIPHIKQTVLAPNSHVIQRKFPVSIQDIVNPITSPRDSTLTKPDFNSTMLATFPNPDFDGNVGTIKEKSSIGTVPRNSYYSKLNVGLHKVGNYIKDNPDLIGLGVNLTGNLAASLINRSAIKGMRYGDAPIPISAQKLPTEVNIEPQVSSIRENVAGQERLISDNTADSRVALARRQRVRNQGAQQYQTLFGNKLNTELQLLTADRLNRQGVDAQNVNQYNQWRRGLYDFENRRREMLAENSVAGINNAAEAIAGERGYFARKEARQQNLLDMALIAATSPNAQNVIGSKEFEDFLRKIGYDGKFSLLRKRING